MRILFCSEIAPTSQLGATKVLIELADALNAAGHDCELQGPDALGMASVADEASRLQYCERLAVHLARVAGGYDVVEYNYAYLPVDRSRFPPDVLLVARSVLLGYHAVRLRVPGARGIRAAIGRMLFGRRRRAERAALLARADRTLMNADLVNVSNYEDHAELVDRGVDPTKAVVIPFGMSAARRTLFDRLPVEPPSRPVVAFVGSFDYRKGATDFPRIFGRIRDAVPDAQLALLGTAGLLPTAEQVLAFFPRRFRSEIDVRPRFAPNDLPALLARCSVGVFPSYYEGFAFGVLEMLAAAVPVVAYDSPGPPMMLDREWLVAPGDVNAMADKAIALLRNRPRLEEARKAARQVAARFDWSWIAQRTADIYGERLRVRRGAGSRVSVA